MQVSLPTQYNDQQQAPVGALSGALGRIQANRPLRELREIAKGVTKQLPEAFQVDTLCFQPANMCSAGTVLAAANVSAQHPPQSAIHVC